MKAIRWALINGCFALALWFGFVEGVAGAKNVAMFLAWLSAVLGMFCATDAAVEELRKKPRSVPQGVNTALDVAVAIFLVWFGAWLTAIAYTIGHSILLSAREKADKLNEAAQ